MSGAASGVARFMFTFELASEQQAVVGCPLWLGGRVEVLERHGRVRPYLAPFQPQAQPVTLPHLGIDQTLQLTLDVSDRQLQLVEENRSAGGIQAGRHFLLGNPATLARTPTAPGL